MKSVEPRPTRWICGRVAVAAGSPSVAQGSGFTVVDTAAGQVQVVFTLPGERVLSAVATAIEGTDATAHSVKVDAVTEASSVVFGIYAHDATDGVLVDNVGFYFIVALSDSSS